MFGSVLREKSTVTAAHQPGKSFMFVSLLVTHPPVIVS